MQEEFSEIKTTLIYAHSTVTVRCMGSVPWRRLTCDTQVLDNRSFAHHMCFEKICLVRLSVCIFLPFWFIYMLFFHLLPLSLHFVVRASKSYEYSHL